MARMKGWGVEWVLVALMKSRRSIESAGGADEELGGGRKSWWRG